MILNSILSQLNVPVVLYRHAAFTHVSDICTVANYSAPIASIQAWLFIGTHVSRAVATSHVHLT